MATPLFQRLLNDLQLTDDASAGKRSLRRKPSLRRALIQFIHTDIRAIAYVCIGSLCKSGTSS